MDKKETPRATATSLQEDALGTVIRVMLGRWHAMTLTGHREILRTRTHGIHYAQSRDMAFILRAILPMAVELASSARPEWRDKESALAVVAGKYVLALTSREQGLDVLSEGIGPLVANGTEEAEAFTAFGASLSLVLLMYVLLMPHMADTMGEVSPHAVEAAVSGTTRTLMVEMHDGCWPFSWWRKRCRRKYVQHVIAQGALPEADWVARFMQSTTGELIQRSIQEFIRHGAMHVDETGPPVDGENAP